MNQRQATKSSLLLQGRVQPNCMDVEVSVISSTALAPNDRGLAVIEPATPEWEYFGPKQMVFGDFSDLMDVVRSIDLRKLLNEMDSHTKPPKKSSYPLQNFVGTEV